MADKQAVSFKETLNLPHTDFPIRPHPATDDLEVLMRWEQEQLYKKAFEHNKGNKKFILHDGPPYSNGHIHLGHAYNKIIKDIITKSQRMAGNHVPFMPGWDCHGLPIELKVTQEQPGLTGAALQKACRVYAQHWITEQRKSFKRLGALMDFDRPYTTMDYAYEATIVRAFGRFVEQGYIERKNKTVPWCFSCQTVLASAEIEYQDRKDPSVYALFPLTAASVDKALPKLKGRDINLLVWTTTPWTLPLNRAVFLHPTASYQVLDANGTLIVVGAALADAVSKLAGVEKKVVAEFPSTALTGAQAQHPFVPHLVVPVLADSFVSLDEGTACVHSAPGCGPEDYEMGLRYGLEIFSPLSADGRYTVDIQPAELINMSITDAQGWVITTLSTLGKLFFKASVKHSYPHCWRCHQGLMFRATRQWFCNLAQHGLRQRALQAIDTVTFIPERSSNFLRATIQHRLEWCLSRQRTWGVPIPALVCKNGDSIFIDKKLIAFVAAGIEREGIEFWDRVPLEDLQPTSLRCSECGSTDFEKERDILDVWFESGISHTAVLKHYEDLSYPADLYVEGVDQHRAWFQSSLLTSLVLDTQPCYKGVITHGFTVDAQGRKMSKSLGNVIAPQDLIDQLGTDCLRLWASSLSYEGDVVVSQALLDNVKEVYRKIRNTCRFLLSNLYDFDSTKDLVPVSSLLLLDRYALHQLAAVNATIRNAYDTYTITQVFHELGDYCSAELSSFYLDVIKDRLYVEQADGLQRRSAQTACWYILDTLTKLVAPVLSITAELIADEYQKNKQSSIHLQSFAQVPAVNGLVTEQWDNLRQVRSAILKAIELEREKGLIKHTLEVGLTVYYDAKLLPQLDAFIAGLAAGNQSKASFFKEWFIISQLEFVDSKRGLTATILPGLYSAVTHARGDKCPRCWQWEETTHQHALCARCQSIVRA